MSSLYNLKEFPGRSEEKTDFAGELHDTVVPHSLNRASGELRVCPEIEFTAEITS